MSNGSTAAAPKGFGPRVFIKDYGNVVIFLVIWIAAMLFVRNFASLDNNVNLMKQAAVPAITCLGMTFVLMTGGIDLSVGYVVGLCSYIFGALAVYLEIPPALAILLTVGAGCVCGLVNGILVQMVHIPAFIVTLGTGYVFFGIAQIVSNGSAINNIPAHILAIGRTDFLGLPAFVWYGAIVVVVCWFFLHRTVFGRTLSALGLNRQASWLSGIRNNRVVLAAYICCSGLAALSACLMSIRVNSCTPIMGGTSYTFEAITAAILGGASLSGGVGTAWGSVLGVFTITIVSNCVSLLGVNHYIYEAALAFVILVAIVFEKLKNRVLQ